MEKINLIFFFCCFWKNVGENKFKFIFSAVFGKTLEKINLNFFSAVLVKKTVEKINLLLFFLLFTLAPSYCGLGASTIIVFCKVMGTIAS